MRPFYLLLLLCFVYSSHAQQQSSSGGRLSGSLQTNANFFIRDTAIGAANTPQYDRQLFGGESWLELNYSNWGFDMGIRFDVFHNSNLLNPQGSYTDQGIGRWFVKKKIDKFKFEAGYIYDQIGSGIIFRAYEQRPLAIDNALAGISVGYEFTEDWTLKAFTGRQKQQFGLYDSILKGFNAEGFIASKEEAQTPWTLAPGIGMVNKTLADETMNNIVSAISTYTPQDSIGANYNTYAFSVYNTMTYGPITWYIEGAYKSKEVIFDPFADKLNWSGEETTGKLVQRAGNIIYSTISYADNGLGITLEGKRTENFNFRTNPFVSLNQGAINFLPPMARENSFRLQTRYNAATQELGEQAFQIDVRYSPNRKWGALVNFSNIQLLDGTQLYREIFTEFSYRYKRKWHLLAGFQIQQYNQEIYEVKPNVPEVQTIAPYVEWTYKLSRKKSLRFQAQYMYNEQDFGSWLFGLVEFGMAPHWTFSVSDMYNVVPTKTDKIHYPRIDVSYTKNSNRFIASYVKQVEGVVCTGGICRFEPAFSGFKLGINSTF